MFKCFLDIYCESCIKDTVTNKTCTISVLVEHTLFWLKSSFGFFCKMVQKNLNKLFCQPNILVKEVPKKEKKKKTQIFQTEANAIKRRNRILWWGGCKTDATLEGSQGGSSWGGGNWMQQRNRSCDTLDRVWAECPESVRANDRPLLWVLNDLICAECLQ